MEHSTPLKGKVARFDWVVFVWAVPVLHGGNPQQNRRGAEVARIDGNKWSIGILGFGSRLFRSVLMMIDRRAVYTPLFAGNGVINIITKRPAETKATLGSPGGGDDKGFAWRESGDMHI